MKKKPSSAKKHRHLRRNRRVNWEQSRLDMEYRDRLADDAAHKYIQEIMK